MLEKIKQKYNARCVFPATTTQTRLFYEYESNKASNIIIRVFVWHGMLNVKKISELLINYFSKNQIFNCFFIKEAGQVYGLESNHKNYTVENIDAMNWDINDIELDIRKRSNGCFKMDVAPLWRISIYKLTNDEHIIATFFHGIIIDFDSLNKIFSLVPQDYPSNKKEKIYPYTSFDEYAFYEKNKTLKLKKDFLILIKTLPDAYSIPLPYKTKTTTKSKIGIAHYFSSECRGVKYRVLKNIFSSSNFYEKNYFMAKLIYFLSRKLKIDSVTIMTTHSNRDPQFHDTIGPVYTIIPVSIANITSSDFNDVITKVNHNLTSLEKYACFSFPTNKTNQQFLFSYFLGAEDGFDTFRMKHSINKKHILQTKSEYISVYPLSSTVINFDLYASITHAHDAFILKVFYQEDLFSFETIETLFHDFFEI